MGFLCGKSCYFGGPIQHQTSENWRAGPIKVLTERYGIRVFDPHADEKQKAAPKLKEAQQRKDVAEMHRIAADFVHKDLQEVGLKNFLVSYIPYKVPTVGTHHEIIMANEHKKPTLLVTDGDQIERIPLWYRGFIKPEFMFSSWEDMYLYLDKVDAGLCKNQRRWSYIYGLV